MFSRKCKFHILVIIVGNEVQVRLVNKVQQIIWKGMAVQCGLMFGYSLPAAGQRIYSEMSFMSNTPN